MPPESTGKLSHNLAMAIAREIVLEKFPEGHFLGRETELLKKYQVSRASYREAIRLLEWKGVVSAITGPTGGLFVTRPTKDACVNLLRDYIDLSAMSPIDVIAARRILETMAVQLATRHINDDAIHALKKMMNTNFSEFSRTESTLKLFDVLRTIYSQSANPALTIFIEPLNFSSIDFMGASQWPYERFKLGAKKTWLCIQDMVDKIISGDEVLAVSALHRYLDIVVENFSPTEIDSSPARIYPEWYNTAKNKLAQNLIYGIRSDISERNISPGEMIGSADLLMKRYNVGRPIFREAARIMELIGIAAFRKGRNGGLIATKPDPTNTINAIVLFLESIPEIRIDDILEIRTVLEEFSAFRAATLRTDTEIKEFKDALTTQTNAQDGETLISASVSIQQLIGRISGNQVVSLYNRVLLSCSSFRPAPEELARRAWTHKTLICSTQKLVVDAIIEGDSSLAKRRMRQHRRQSALLFEEGSNTSI